MARIPDCREDSTYNERFLNEPDSQYILGYDSCVDNGITSFFDNIDNFIPEITLALGLDEDDEIEIDCSIVNGDKEFYEYTEEELDEVDHLTSLLLLIRTYMCQWAEHSRDELIVSLLENTDEQEYEELKTKSDRGEWKNALVRHQDYLLKYEAGEVPTYYEYKIDDKGNSVRIGHCPNGTIIVEPYKGGKNSGLFNESNVL